MDKIISTQCPNCFANDFLCLTVIDFEKDKIYACANCGTRYNPEDTKETAEIPEHVNTPSKLSAYLTSKMVEEGALPKMDNSDFL